MWPLGRSTRPAPSLDEELLRGLMADARRWIARYAGPRPDLDDLLQESMAELVVALDHFRGESSVRTYAHRIVLRTTARELAARRLRGQRFELVAEVDRTSASDPERELGERRAVQKLYDALGKLSEKRRNAFVLCAIERLPRDEAATIEGTSVETLRARLKHARWELEAALQHDPALAPYFGGGA